MVELSRSTWSSPTTCPSSCVRVFWTSVATQSALCRVGSHLGEPMVVKRNESPSEWGEALNSTSASKMVPVLKLKVVVVSPMVPSEWPQQRYLFAQVSSPKQGSPAGTTSLQFTSRNASTLVL